MDNQFGNLQLVSQNEVNTNDLKRSKHQRITSEDENVSMELDKFPTNKALEQEILLSNSTTNQPFLNLQGADIAVKTQSIQRIERDIEIAKEEQNKLMHFRIEQIKKMDNRIEKMDNRIEEMKNVLKKDYSEWTSAEINEFVNHKQLRESIEKEKELIEKEKERIEKEKERIEKENEHIEKEKDRIEKEKERIEKENERIERIEKEKVPKPNQHLKDVDSILQTALSAKFDSLPTVNELQDYLKKKILRRIPIPCDDNKFCVLAPQQDELVYQNEVSEQSKLGDIVYGIIHHEVSEQSKLGDIVYSIIHHEVSEQSKLGDIVYSLIHHEVSLDSSESMLIYTIDHLVRAVLSFFKILSISLDRNVYDSSLSASRVRPDFLCWLNSVLVFRGEEKARRRDFLEAKQELEGKLDSWPLLYVGSLPYLLSYACAGENFQFFAITSKLHFLSISPVYMLTLAQHRFDIIRSMINIVRLFTIMLPHLPQENPLPLYGTRKFSSCHIQFFENYVIKTCEISVVSLYPNYLRRLYDDTAHVQHLVHCNSLVTKGSELKLKLFPIGIKRYPCSEYELSCAVKCVLLALQGLHKAGYVHRDIRWPNILNTAQNTWVLIDLEFAGRIGDPHPCPREHPPEREWVEKSDVYLVGKLLITQIIVKLSPIAKDFLSVSYENLNLENRCTVKEALDHPWIKNEVNDDVVEEI